MVFLAFPSDSCTIVVVLCQTPAISGAPRREVSEKLWPRAREGSWDILSVVLQDLRSGRGASRVHHHLPPIFSYAKRDSQLCLPSTGSVYPP